MVSKLPIVLQTRCREEIKEAVENTKLARKYSASVEVHRRNARIENVGKYQSCMASKLPPPPSYQLDASVNVPKDLPQWYDGSKMMKLAKKAKEVAKGMKGKHKEFNRKNVAEIRSMAKEATQFSKVRSR